jgi:hypothetical protein
MLSEKYERHFVGTTRRRNKNEEKSYRYCRERDDRCFNAHKKRLLYCFARAQIVLLLEGKISLYVYIYMYRNA